MLSAGTNITVGSDRLFPISVEDFYHRIRCPKPAIDSLVRQLRTIRLIDDKRYQALKRTLPYVVCGTFTPPMRKIENFGCTEFFILDLDHLMPNSIDINELRERLKDDELVHMCFASPGGDGLKVMFRLKKPCYDAGLYSLFYRAFAQRWASANGLEQVADTRTCDVARACFVSVDDKAWHNPDSIAVDVADYIDVDNPQALSDEFHRQHSGMEQGAQETRLETEATSLDPDDDVMARIRAQLSAREVKSAPQPQVYVPQEVERVLGGIIKEIEDIGVEVSEVREIQYGKKIIMRSNLRKAELNLFYGQRGFTVVESPRRGTSAELNALMARLVRQHLARFSA